MVQRLARLEPAQRQAIRETIRRDGRIHALMLAEEILNCDLGEARLAIHVLEEGEKS
jgi:hypothetical protein